MTELLNAIVDLFVAEHGTMTSEETHWHAARWAYRDAGLLTAHEYAAVLAEIPLP